MLYENFVWTESLRKEFSKVVLDNYHCFNSLEEGVEYFIKTKSQEKNGKRNKPTTSNFVWEIRNN